MDRQENQSDVSRTRRRGHYLWELRFYFRQVLGQITIGSLAGILANTAVVLPAIMLGRAINVVLAAREGRAGHRDILAAAAGYVAGVLIGEVPRAFKRYFLQTTNARIRASIRVDALRGILDWPMERLHRTAVGTLMAKINGDVEMLGVALKEFITEMWDTVLFSVSLVVAMFAYDPHVSSLALLPVPVAMVLAKLSGRWVAARTACAREANASLVACLQEHLSALRLLRLFGRSRSAVERVSGLSRKQADENLALVRLRAGLQPVYSTLMTSGVVLVVWLGGSKVAAGAITLGAFVTYLELYLKFVNRAFRVPQMINAIQGGSAAYDRLEPLLAPPLSVRNERRFSSFRPSYLLGMGAKADDSPVPRRGALGVSVKDLTFRYPGASQPALRSVSLEIPAGAMVAVTGPVGCGKTAMIRAMLGLYPLERGRILIDGQDAQSIGHARRRAILGYLPEDAHIFSGTVYENVLMGDDGQDGRQEAVGAAVRLAALDEDLKVFPDGLDTEVGEMGIRVSGGQRQRIALARSIAACPIGAPGLLLLDDPFSAVDVDTESQIIRSLHQALGSSAPPEDRATIVLVSHRLAAFPMADIVVVIDDGRIVEQGTHEQLMRRGGVYHRIFRAQRRTEHAVDPAVEEKR